MQNKDILRKKYFIVRKKKYFDIKPSFFNPLIKLIKKNIVKKPSMFLFTILHLLRQMFLSCLKQKLLAN